MPERTRGASRANLHALLPRIAPGLAIVAVTALMVGIQAGEKSVLIGSDTTFHFQRFYDAYMQLRTGRLSWWQTNFGFQQCGRVVNAVYGPLFAYLMGAVLLLTGTWLRFQIVVNAVAYLLCGLGMYAFCRRAQEASLAAVCASDAAGSTASAGTASPAPGEKDGPHDPRALAVRRVVACAVAIAYMCVGWQARWQTNSNMGAWGAILAPYLGLVCVRMLVPGTRRRDVPASGRHTGARPRVGVLSLALVVAVMAQIHLMSCAMFLLVLVPFWVLGMVRATRPGERRDMLLRTLAAAGVALVLTADVWAGLAELMLRNHTAQPVGMMLGAGALGLDPGLFSKLTIGILPLALLAVALAWAWRRHDAVALPLAAVGAAFLLVSSRLVPWDAIGLAAPALTHTIQFPVRLTAMAYPLLFAALAVALGSLATQPEATPAQPAAGEKPARPALLPHLARPRLALAASLALAFAAVVAQAGCVAWMSRAFHEGFTCAAHVMYLTDASVADLQRAATTQEPGRLMGMISKRTPDYLPNHNLTDAHGLSAQYQVEVLVAHVTGAFGHRVLADGGLELTWRQDGAARVRVPVITYAQSQVTVNGRRVAADKLKVDRIGMPTVQGRKGANTLVLRFQPSVFTRAVIVVSMAS
ncbi:MAG: hypothetical protein ACI38Z_01340, partial [Parafannyhessea sp.]|uniref:hypothetical protein n=1 Tax=Parafannyhessea sp. TaxID=2847324 RepID=UPI003F1263E0